MQFLCTLFVSFRLFPDQMIATIDFNNQFLRQANKIRDIIHHNMLSPEMSTLLASFQKFPQQTFSISRILPILNSILL